MSSKKRFNAISWRSYLAALACGLISSFIFSPYFLLPLGFIGFTGLLWLLEKSILTLSLSHREKEARALPKRVRAFFIGWWFGLGHFGASIYWVHNSLLTDPERYAWLVPFAILLIPSILAIYIGSVTFAYSFLPGTLRLTKLSGFAALWVIGEYIRTWTPFGGFPWNLAGYGWAISENVLQLASITGIYGLSFLLIVMCSYPAITVQHKSLNSGFWTLIMVITVVWTHGIWHLSGETEKSGPMLRIVQANIPVQKIQNPEEWFSIIQDHIEMSRQKPLPQNMQLIIWPESANSFLLEREPPLRAMLADIVPEGGMLLTGSMRGEGNNKNWQVWNTIHGINDEAEIVATYDKATLVPFGEYVPLRWMFFFMDAMTMPGDFTRGPGAQTFAVNGIPPFSPLICYEAIFPQRVVEKKSRPAWLLNVTNDAWFGDSNGPYQHFEMARVRAIEQGLPLVRAANTGISAVFDAYGRVVKQTRLNEKTVLDVPLPPSLPPTFYSRFGDWPMLGLILLCLAGSILPRRAK